MLGLEVESRSGCDNAVVPECHEMIDWIRWISMMDIHHYLEDICNKSHVMPCQKNGKTDTGIQRVKDPSVAIICLLRLQSESHTACHA